MFAKFVERKTHEAEAATLPSLETTHVASEFGRLLSVGNQWTSALFDGRFSIFPSPITSPAVSLVFVQSRDGNTGSDNPGDLGGGPTDRHVIYEGLSRVAADAVMAGATTAKGTDVFFSVWHPALVALRADLGFPRHPAQIVVSRTSRLNPAALLFNVPAVPVFVLAAQECRRQCAAIFTERPWVRIVPFDHDDWHAVLAYLRHEHRIARISCVGGASTASSLIDAGVVQDLCLTTTARAGGRPHTPFYTGTRPPVLKTIVRKESRVGAAEPIVFEHFAVE